MTQNTVTIQVGDARAGSLSIIYLLISLGFIGWLLFDIWIDAHTLARVLRYDLKALHDSNYHLLAYTVLGGAIGAIVNGLRSILVHYKGFDRHHAWKYIAAPWMGAALALMGFALLKSTVAIFGGTAATATPDTTQALANFAIGALAGYGSKDVFVWLDSQVEKLFVPKTEAPDTTGKDVAVAVQQIQGAELSVGAVVGTPVETPEEAGKVVEQVPEPGTMIDSGEAVSMVVGTSANGKRAAKSKKPS
ncbi:MAG TPA: PASTA domain-containing protein [Anaerolineales bacterium]